MLSCAEVQRHICPGHGGEQTISTDNTDLAETVTRSAASPVNSTFMRRAAALSGQISLLIKSTTFSLIPFRRQLVWKPRCTLARGCRFRFFEPLSSSKVASSRCMSQAYSAQANGSDSIPATLQPLGARFCPDVA